MIAAVVIIGLAAFRMALLLTREAGPFDVFVKFRQAVNEPGKMHPLRLEVSKALECIWCTSFWMTLIAAGLWFIEPWIIRILAATTIPILLSSIMDD